MPVRVSPAEARDKWANRLSGATSEIAAGVARVNRAPGEAAAQKFDKWRAGVRESEEKWRANVQRVSLGEWQQSMTEIGIPRVASGAQQKAGKYEAFASEFFPHLDAGVRRIEGMDDTTLEARINRSVAMMRHNATFRRGGRGRIGGGA